MWHTKQNRMCVTNNSTVNYTPLWALTVRQCRERAITHKNKTLPYRAQRSSHSGWALSSVAASPWTGPARSVWTWPGRRGSPGSVTLHCGPHHTHQWCSAAALLTLEAWWMCVMRTRYIHVVKHVIYQIEYDEWEQVNFLCSVCMYV